MANFVSITQKAFYNALVTGELVIKDKAENGTITSKSVSIFDENGKLTDEVIAYAQEQIAKIEGRNEKHKGSGSLTKAQKANLELAEAIFENMEAGTTYTSADIVGFGIEGVATVQKVTALMKILAGKVEVVEVKKGGSKGKVKGYTAIKSAESEDEVVETDSEDEVTE